MERFSELIKNLSNAQKAETFIYFTKITVANLSINKIIPVSIALMTPFFSLFLDCQIDVEASPNGMCPLIFISD